MTTALALVVTCALLLKPAAAQVTVEKAAPLKNGPPTSQPATPTNPPELAALEKKLLRTWQGPVCGGDFTFNPDGTFDVKSFTPGQNILTGTWSLRWDALPPTLSLTFKTSDFKRTYPNEPDYKYVGKTIEAKLLERSDTALAFKAANPEWDWRGEPRIEAGD